MASFLPVPVPVSVSGTAELDEQTYSLYSLAKNKAFYEYVNSCYAKDLFEFTGSLDSIIKDETLFTVPDERLPNITLTQLIGEGSYNNVYKTNDDSKIFRRLQLKTYFKDGIKMKAQMLVEEKSSSKNETFLKINRSPRRTAMFDTSMAPGALPSARADAAPTRFTDTPADPANDLWGRSKISEIRLNDEYPPCHSATNVQSQH
jgi:hypothetical protein